MTFTKEEISWIRNETENAEQIKTITKDLLNFMIDKQLFKLIVPQALNGKGLSLPDAAQIFQDASYIDGNFGWLVTIGTGGGMFTANFSKKAAEEYFTPIEAVIAGSGFPAGIAEKTDGGYIINGEWFYCSGSDYASMFTATCKVTNSDPNNPKFLSFVFEKDQVEVIPDWDAFGLKATTSNTIRITNQFVPEERAFSIFEMKNEYKTKVHDFPFLAFSEASFAAMVLGIGRHFLEEVRSITEERKKDWQQQGNRYTFMMEKVEQEEKRWEKANIIFHKKLARLWEKHTANKELTETEQQAFRTISKKIATTMLTCANHLFRFIGMQAVMEYSTLNRIWRNLHTAAQHTFLTPTNTEETNHLQ
ncbi:acyl-CoA dehydrogenase [Cerasibacillus terrae]|uniref:Acyl-CoA dehydrogenase n=1 Tax=Cerasibacillus terrae TaxID=2498845 RepID=A0A5C8NTH4_9BACI|nr:acyl-CoA dehydrogenase [Cerasibacillus terrae]TXL64393.1 acyl-CoA dehydrogenase [Cerasibacillus terrae]